MYSASQCLPLIVLQTGVLHNSHFAVAQTAYREVFLLDVGKLKKRAVKIWNLSEFGSHLVRAFCLGYCHHFAEQVVHQCKVGEFVEECIFSLASVEGYQLRLKKLHE